ncbi:MAG: SurA N-terminal domain-containing protein [Lachnoclostridium sp.]|nr:SurA N-terminal domain-containing protein [Lachnospira sp.]MCM1248878.1 SurA N-terminal domain-containing protein [Lachnoclostridium sp.]MCM1535382.1 SurA N-terminal domain-containing protein [Clostridium sp.]
MSGKKNTQQNAEQKEQKVVTKYDLKVQRRKAEKEREQRQTRIRRVIAIVAAVALVCLVASFPIRTYLAVHETYVKINGENITRVEFDYYYNQAKLSYQNQYGYYLSQYGFDMNADPATEMYSETLTFKDYYENMAVDAIKQDKALLAEAKAEGFTYDTSEEYAEFEKALKEAAAANETSVKKFVQQQYGTYATQSRIKKYLEEAIFLSAYYDHVTEVKTPSDAEIESHYAENKGTYDSVDYRISTITAQLPTEPTELADTADSSDTTDNAAAGSSDTANQAYEPSQAEISKAMEDARALADVEERVVATTGERNQGVRRQQINSLVSVWLFEDSRKAGDTTVIEDLPNNCYYVVAFEARYRDETLPVNARVLITDTMEGQAVLDEWNAGGATEENFAELCKKYSVDTAAEQGGLYKNLAKSDMDERIAEWLFDPSRNPGDTTSIKDEESDTYVIYYVGTGDGDPEWKADAKDTLLSTIMSDYLVGITEKVTVEDPKGKLNYLKVQEAEANEQEAQQDTDSEENADSTQDSGDSEGAQESSQEGADAAQ